MVGRIRAITGILRAHPHPYRLLASRVLARIPLPIQIQRPGFVINLTQASLSMSYWIDPECRAQDEDFVRKFLNPGDTYVDVGANIGTLVLTALTRVGESGTIYAIEPHPRTCEQMHWNLYDNRMTLPTSRVRELNLAVGEESGRLRISDIRDDDQNGVVPAGGIEVEVRTLDEILAHDTTPIALLKIDTEGFELPALRGARKTLQRTQVVLFEVWERHLEKYGFGVPEMLMILREADFQTFAIRGTRLEPVPENFQADELQNLLAVRDVAEACRRLGMTR